MRRAGNYYVFKRGHQYHPRMTLHLSTLDTNTTQDVSFIFYSVLLLENTKPTTATSGLYQKNCSLLIH